MTVPLVQNKLEKKCQEWRVDNKTIVLVYGYFTFLHIGHIRFLQLAKQKGDVLLVVLTSDDEKGLSSSFDQDTRVKALAELSCVDDVVVNSYGSIERMLSMLNPHIYAKGSDYQTIHNKHKANMFQKEQSICKKLGIELVITQSPLLNVTDSINTFFASFSDELKQYIALFKKNNLLQDITQKISDISTLKVLVIGDAILDEYRYCQHLGTSSKDTVLTVKHESNDVFAGGILAVANHVAQFSHQVDLVTAIGDNAEEEAFIKSHLSSAVNPYFLIQDTSQTLRKIKYVEQHTLNKLFGVYVMNESQLSQKNEDLICQRLHETLSNYDLVLVADFGHGAINDVVRKQLVDKSSFLAVNTQANAGNQRIHTISKYSRADYVSISETELRLDVRDFDTNIRPLMLEACKRFKSQVFVATRGRHGSSIACSDGTYMVVPAFNSKIVDRIGSGDACFAITSMLASQRIGADVLGLVGNAVGSLAVEILGNKEPINKVKLTDYLMQLLS